MKQGRNPTRKQKELIGYYGLNADNWFVVNDLPWQLKIMHRIVGQIKILEKGGTL